MGGCNPSAFHVVWLLALLPRRGLLGLKPGDEFEIKLGRKQVRLVPVGGEEVEE